MAEIVPQSYELVPIDSVQQWPKNPRRGDVVAIGSSIEANQFFGACVVQRSTGHILAGNHRWLAAKSQGLERIPVIFVDVDDERAARIAVVDNRASDMATWDESALAGLLKSLAEGEESLAGTLYEPEDLSGLLKSLGEAPVERTDPDEAPAIPQAPVSRSGDLWVLGGRHRLLCGDARVRDDYETVLAGKRAALCVTDPPYGVNIGAKNRALDEIDRGGLALHDLDGDRGIAEVRGLWSAAFGILYEVLAPGVPYYIFGPQGGELGLLLLLLLQQAKMDPRHVLIWAKNRPSFSIGRLDYDYQHEPIVYGWRPGGRHPWYAQEPKTSLLYYDRPQRSSEHATMKPVALITELIRNSTRRQEVVLDPFVGSGTTIIAAEQSGRLACCLEIEPRYVDVAVRRWETVTGLPSQLGEGGPSFSEVADGRGLPTHGPQEISA